MIKKLYKLENRLKSEELKYNPILIEKFNYLHRKNEIQQCYEDALIYFYELFPIYTALLIDFKTLWLNNPNFCKIYYYSEQERKNMPLNHIVGNDPYLTGAFLVSRLEINKDIFFKEFDYLFNTWKVANFQNHLDPLKDGLISSNSSLIGFDESGIPNFDLVRWRNQTRNTYAMINKIVYEDGNITFIPNISYGFFSNNQLKLIFRLRPKQEYILKYAQDWFISDDRFRLLEQLLVKNFLNKVRNLLNLDKNRGLLTSSSNILEYAISICEKSLDEVESFLKDIEKNRRYNEDIDDLIFKPYFDIKLD